MKLSRNELITYIYDQKIVVDGKYNFRRLFKKETKQIIIENINRYVLCGTSSIPEKIYWLINNYTTYPKKCRNCEKPITTFNCWKSPYVNNHCSLKCGTHSKTTIEKRKKTLLVKYGVENPSQSSEIQEKKKKTWCLGGEIL